MIRRVFPTMAIALVAACSSEPAISSTHSVTLAVDPIVMLAGDSIAPPVVVMVDGTPRVPNAREIVVTSSDPGVIFVASNGALVAVGDGTTNITVAWAAARSNNATQAVSVTSERLSSVDLLVPDTMTVGDTTGYVVTGTINGGRPIARPTSVTVASRNPAVVTTNGALAVALAPGTAWIVATASTGVTDSALVTVLPGGPANISITPQDSQLVEGQSVLATARVTDRLGNAVTSATPSFQSSAPTVATVQATGAVTAVSAGSALIIASSGALADTLRLTVVAAPAMLSRLVVTPDSVTLAPGGTISIQVQAFDAQNRSVAVPPLTWQSMTVGITVPSAGVVQAAATVTSSIVNGVVRVSSGAISAQVRVDVNVAITPPPPPPPSDNGFVQIRWVGDSPTPAVAAAFEAARQRINGLFLSFNGVAPTNPNSPADFCISGSPGINETVNGIILYAEVAPIDGVGSILGSAGPCLVRTGNLLPIVGVMRFDSADMSVMASSGLLNGVVLHEMMHTLGFGTIWGPGAQNEVASPSGTDPRYLGSIGQAAYAALGGTATADAANGVPVENTGGSGTRGAHWRESVFHTELMTGWADGSLAMSRVTIGALRDFGYDVDLNKADSFSLQASLMASGAQPAKQIGETTIAPLGTVSPAGRFTPFSGSIPR
jgi:hypothetical protein